MIKNAQIIDGNYKWLIRNNIITLEHAIEAYLSENNPRQLISLGKITQNQYDKFRQLLKYGGGYLADFTHYTCLFWPSCFTALMKNKITTEQAFNMHDYHYLFALFTDNGFKALEQKLITLEQVDKMPTSEHLDYLLMKNGFKALQQRLITPEQVAQLPDARYLSPLFSGYGGNGLKALQGKLILPEQVAKMPSIDHLRKLFSKKGMKALIEGKITSEEVINMPNAQVLENHLNTLLVEQSHPNSSIFGSVAKMN